MFIKVYFTKVLCCYIISTEEYIRGVIIVNFGIYLKQKRLLKNLSLHEVEKLSKVSNSYLSQVETGKRGIPKPQILKSLAPCYGLSYEELMKAAGYIEEDLNSNNFPSNLKLVRGDMSHAEFVNDIQTLSDNPLFSIDLLKSLENGTILPTNDTIDILSSYAGVDNSFWYKENDPDSLVKAKESFIKISKENILPRNKSYQIWIPSEYPQDIIEWLERDDILNYLELSKMLYDKNINPDVVQAFLFNDRKKDL